MQRVYLEMVHIIHLRISDLEMVISWILKLTRGLISVINLRNYTVNQLSLRLLLCTVSYCLYNNNNPVNINVRYKTRLRSSALKKTVFLQMFRLVRSELGSNPV